MSRESIALRIGRALLTQETEQASAQTVTDAAGIIRAACAVPLERRLAAVALAAKSMIEADLFDQEPADYMQTGRVPR